eukprot:224421_1
MIENQPETDRDADYYAINENTAYIQKKHHKNKITLFGQFMVLVSAALSIGIAEITQIATSKFKHPLLLRYINTTMVCSMFAPTYIWHRYYLWKLKSKMTSQNNSIKNMQHKETYPYTFIKRPLHKLILMAIIGSLFENGGGYFFYIAVTGVTIPTFGALTALSAVFTYIFSVILLNEPVILWKIMAVMSSFGGVLFFVFDLNNNKQSGETHDTWWGILFTILVSIMWPINDIIFKMSYNKHFTDHKVIGTFYYTSMMGLIATIVFVFVFWIDPLTVYEWKHISFAEIEWIIVNGVYLIFCDMFYNITNSLTSPLLINIGNLVSIPFGFIVDMFVHNYKLNIYPIIGTCFIMLGFLMMEILKPPKFCKCCNIFDKVLYQKITEQ